MSSGPFESLKQAGDVAAAGVTVGTIMQWLPAAAALFTIVWTVWRFYERFEARFQMARERRMYIDRFTAAYGHDEARYKFLPIEELRRMHREMGDHNG